MIASAQAGDDLRTILRIALSPLQLSAVFEGQTLGSETGASDDVVPIAGATLAGAVRVAAVRDGRITLMKHEAKSGIRLGALKIACPIALTDGMLGTRMGDLAARRDSAEFASTFIDLLTAERALTQALRIKRAVIGNWSRTAPRDRALSFNLDIGRVIGRGVSRGGIVPMTRIEVGLRKETYNGDPYFIVSSHPSP